MERDAKAVIFDVDQTLTLSKTKISRDMADKLSRLISKLPTAIISGATKERLAEQVVNELKLTKNDSLLISPTSGSSLYEYGNGRWDTIYEVTIDDKEAKDIAKLITEVVNETGSLTGQRIWGPQIEFRGSQVTFSALGQMAPYEVKKSWDANKSERQLICKKLRPLLKDYEVALGGTTSIDVVPKGINKAYGVNKIAAYLNVITKDMLYIGDDLEPYGNDHIVLTTGINTISVSNPTETEKIISKLLDTHIND